MASSLYDWEKQIIKFLLRGEHPSLDILRKQIAMVTVRKRHYSGIGVFTAFDVPANAPHLSQPEGMPRLILECEARIEGLFHPIFVLLFVNEEGAVSTLELASVDDNWPQKVTISSLSFGDEEKYFTQLYRSLDQRISG